MPATKTLVSEARSKRVSTKHGAAGPSSRVRPKARSYATRPWRSMRTTAALKRSPSAPRTAAPTSANSAVLDQAKGPHAARFLASGKDAGTAFQRYGSGAVDAGDATRARPQQRVVRRAPRNDQ